MKRLLIICIAAELMSYMGAPKADASIKIDFEDFNLGGGLFLDVPDTLIFSDVGGSGVSVTIVGGADIRIYDMFKYGNNPNATGQALGDWKWWGGSNTAGTTILFDKPVTSFSLRAGDFGADNDNFLMITAFDAQDQILAQDSVPWNATMQPPFATLSVSAPDISKVIYNSGGSYANSTFIDDLTFVPEPATICLLGFGALSLIRRKNSKKTQIA
jgi:hypothetical protein